MVTIGAKGEFIMMRRHLLLPIVLVLLLSGTALGAGMSVHSEVSTRAAHFFDYETYPEYRDIVVSHPEAYQAGSPFPDWGYQFGYHDESEEAHWPPFMEAFAQYIHDTYPKPWDEETEKLVAFFCGVISHNSADVDWHSGSGLIGIMHHLEFHDDYSTAHTVADGGGEFVLRHSGDMDWLVYNWYFPVEDITEVYIIRGYDTVTPEVLEPRTFMLFVGALANKLGGWLLFPIFAPMSPYMTEELQDLYYGGLDGMSVRVIWEWRKYIDYIENGVPLQSEADWEGYEHDDLDPMQASIELGLRLWQSGLIDIETERSARGITYRAKVPAYLLPPTVPARATGDVRIGTEYDYEHLGEALTAGDFNGDGTLDLAVGAPGYGEVGSPQLGAVYVFYGRATWDEAELDVGDADLVLTGDQVHGRFGWELATVDLNADGRDDLAVSAPTTSAANKKFYGTVYVYCADDTLPTTPTITVTSDEANTNLGHSLAAGDADGDGYADLLIGAPYAHGAGQLRGMIAAYYSGASHTGEVTLADADWRIDGDVDYLLLGMRLGFYHDAAGRRLLLAAAPGTRVDTLQMVGSLRGYDLAADQADAPVFTLTGSGEFDKFGWATAVGDFADDARELIAISAPTASGDRLKQAGSAFLLDLSELSGEQTLDDVTVLAEIGGDEKLARFGWRLAAGDVNGDGVDDLLITQPWRSNGRERVAGGAYLYLGGAAFADAWPAFPDADVSPMGEGGFAMLGKTALLADIDNDGSDEIVLAGGRDSTLARVAGTVKMFFYEPAADDDTVDDDTVDDDTVDDDTVDDDTIDDDITDDDVADDDVTDDDVTDDDVADDDVAADDDDDDPSTSSGQSDDNGCGN